MCLTLLTMILLFFAKTDATDPKKVAPGFFFSMPKTLISGRNDTVCLSTHHSTQLPIKIIVDLKIKEHHFFTTRMIDSEHSCFELLVTKNNKSEPQFASVRVQVQLNGIVYSGHNQDPIIIYPNRKIVFVETDRLTYKSEDTVKIRILTLGNNLLPMPDYKVPYVRIRNPLGIGVVIWENVTSELGLAQLEHQLSRDSVEGKWKIETDGETKIFEVNKYVLPRFKVYILHPKIIYYKTSSVSMQVCAKYSYGGIVKGTAFIRLTDSHHNMKTIQSLKQMINGCADFSFSSEDLSFTKIKQIFPLIDPKISILITATVTEYGTDKIELTTAKSLISLKPFTMKFVKKNLFLPGLPYQGTIQLNNVNIDLNDQVIEICYNIAIKKSWNYLNNEYCSNFTIRDEKVIPFHVLPLKNNVIHFQLNAKSLNHTNIGDNLLVVRLYSQTSTYIKLDQNQPLQTSKCRSVQQFTVQYTTDKLKDHENVTFYYMIKTRGQIYKLRTLTHNVRKHYPNYFNEYKDIIGTNHKHIKSGTSIGKFILKFKLDENIISNYQLLVYHITAEGEVISATTDVEIEPCLNNKVEANWSHKQIAPGGTASLLIETKSESLCAISAIDKAAVFMDDLSTLNVKSILKPFLQEKEYPESGRKTCLSPVKKSREASSLIEADDSIWDLKRKKRFVYPFSEDFDAYDILNKFEIITITNFKIVTKPCYTGPVPPNNNPVQFLTDQYDTQNEDKITSIRSFFPETWLWELVPVRNAAVIHRNLPHTITSWTTNVLCVSAIDGVGFSQTTEIATFQPFFVDVLTPYSIKRGETLYLHTILFNYLTYNIPVRITLGVSDNLKLVDITKKKSFSYCLSSNNTITHVFDVKGIEAGNANVTVLAELDPSYPGHCGPDVLVNKRDVVFKSFLVEPEGYPIKITKSTLLCGSDAHSFSNVTWEVTVPPDVVPETSKSKIIVNGDLLGQTLENLDNLIIMPTGCGEQIMATLAPNLYILKYLNATKSLTSTIKHKIIRNLKIGYQRILNYVHKDGSFSAFGYHDPTGSMFLTAFVVRTLQDVKKYIYVDQKVIDRGVSWILNHQLENGCFSTMLHVFQDMGGTTTENSTAGLTAYVMISLLEGNIEIPESVKTNAKYCIRGHYQLDKYTLAISSYALLRVNWYSEANRMLKRLFQISNQKHNMIWWTNKEINGSVASDIEITSYVLLSLLYQRTQENLAKAHAVVQWLSTKQGPKGSFRSTQDTVVALDALTKYSNFVSSKRTKLNVTVNAIDQKHTFELNSEDRLKSKKIVLKKVNNNIKIHVEGEGCILAQTVTSYFIKQVPRSDAFKLDMEILPVSNIDECSIATLTPCFTYHGPDPQSNMAILEVDLPSGYQADRASLYKLIDEDATTKVKMFEELQQKIVLYLTKLNAQQVCVNFNIKENTIVQSRSNATVKLYDYYKPEYNVLQFYKISDKCKINNLTIPDIFRNVTTISAKKNLAKRNTGINPDFVDIDIELAEPEGIEGNALVYVKPNSSLLLNVTNNIEVTKVAGEFQETSSNELRTHA